LIRPWVRARGIDKSLIVSCTAYWIAKYAESVVQFLQHFVRQ
jgi:hypothetical protein